jgi:peroxiredoxin Q/BCP
MGAGQFSLDWKLSRSKVAHLLWLDVFSSSSAGKVVRPTVGNSTWAVVILLVVTGGAWAVWMQRTVGSPPGQSAPNFSLPSQDGRAISLSQLTGKSVVLFFYSKNSDAQDALEAQTFQRDLEKYTALNTVVIGVSPDSVEDNKEFAIKNSITFPLLTADRVTIDSYKVPISGNGQNLAVEHDTFLISPKGTIITYWPAKEGQIYSDQVLAAIRKQR